MPNPADYSGEQLCDDGQKMESYLRFRWSAFDTVRYPFETTPVRLFAGVGPVGDRVTDRSESDALNWLLSTPVARELIFSELELPDRSYAQLGVVEPVIRNRKNKPGDLDLLLVSDLEPRHCISIQAKRIRVHAVDTLHDKISRGNLGRLAELIEQANASRDLGFHLNYAMVIIQVDGIARSEVNVLHRGILTGQMTRIYERIIESPVHPDVGIIFMEISQPTPVNVDHTGMVAMCLDKRAIPIEQPARITAAVRQLMSERPSQ